ncbi:MAG: hypothetical protein IH626_01730 [Rhodospirillales bacterium]|nr:hypothetical protein [Rhodospirillales bacterium]
MSILDHIPPLPTVILASAEEIVCPWCRRAGEHRHPVDESGCELVDLFECACGRLFQVDADGDDLLAWGVRSGTDHRFMEAMGIDEAAVHHHHYPTVESKLESANADPL